MRNRTKGTIAGLASAGLALALALVVVTTVPATTPEQPAGDTTNAAGYAEARDFSDIAKAAPRSTAEPVTEVGDGGVGADALVSELELPEEAARSIAALPADGQADALAELLAGDPVYSVTREGGTLVVSKPYALKRIGVDASVGKIDDCGAETAIYDPMTEMYILSYNTMHETADALSSLEEQVGAENILVDLPAHVVGKWGNYDSWGVSDMNLIDAEEMLDAMDGLGNVKVAVIDTGINATHEAFKDVTIEDTSCSFITSSGDSLRSPISGYEDQNGHGTHVSGVIASGTPDNVSLIVVKVFDADGNGSAFGMYYAMNYLASLGEGKTPDIVNVSAGFSLAGATSKTIDMNKRYFDQGTSKLKSVGATLVAASGNDGADMGEIGFIPAICDDTVSVGAVRDKSGTRDEYSNYGDELDFVAPGSAIISAWIRSDTAIAAASGTSMATPHVTAFIADLKLMYPDKTPDELVEITKDMSVDFGDVGFDVKYGWGMPVFDLSKIEELKPDVAGGDFWITGLEEGYAYTGREVEPDFELHVRLGQGSHRVLAEGRDYTVSYSGNVEPGTATATITGTGGYRGTTAVHFAIEDR